MKKITFITFIMLFALSSFSQETVKYRDNENSLIEFTISTNEYFVKVDKSQISTLQKSSLILGITEIYDNWVLIKSDFADRKYTKRIAKLSEMLNFDATQIEPVLIYKDGVRQICNGELIIQVKDKRTIDELFSDYTFDVIPNKFVNNQFVIKIDKMDTFNLFNIVNQLQNHSKIDFVEPNFIRLLKSHTNDPFYNSQWSINNQGYLGGTIDADMDVNDAWAISTGAGIKVAIIDEGVDLTHPDLIINLLTGYDATGGNSNGAPSNNDAHGTACAGIVAAIADNNKGVAGVAFNAQIIPVRIAYGNGSGYWITNDVWIADGITWAYQNGADILSNSWGGGSSSSNINNAINNAVNNGRNGKGCLVLFSSGNYNTSVAYPASLSNVIAVGASSMCDERVSSASCDGESWGSNYGTNLDVVAPGVKIYTTDISGSSGYNSGDYKSDFNGTSSACPNAAGVAALVLSLHPNIYESELRDILEGSTDKMSGYSYSYNRPNGTWNNEVGYGRLNAWNALFYASQYLNRHIVGQSELTPGLQAVYSISSQYNNATHYTWTIPTGCHTNYCWEIITGQGTSSVHIRAGNLGVQDIVCKAYNGSTLLGSHYKTVNVQNPNNGGGSNGGDPCLDPYFSGDVIYPPIDPCDNGTMDANSTGLRLNGVFIYNLYGQIVLKSNNKQQVNISQLSSGVYIVKVLMSNNKVFTRKIIKK